PLHPQVQRCAAKALGLFTSGELSEIFLPLLISSIQSEFFIEPEGGVHTPEEVPGVRQGSSSTALCRESVSSAKKKKRDDEDKNEIDASTVHMELDPQEEEEGNRRIHSHGEEPQLSSSPLHAQQAQIEEGGGRQKASRDSPPCKGMQRRMRGRSTRHCLLLSALRQVMTPPRRVFLEILRRERERGKEEGEDEGEEGYMEEEVVEEEKKGRGERRQGEDEQGAKAERHMSLHGIVTPHIQQAVLPLLVQLSVCTEDCDRGVVAECLGQLLLLSIDENSILPS
ncbi:heat repeat-containing protein, partial [Cystoisospora suis]